MQHPTYAALLELGKVQRTIFLCHYLSSEELRREIQEGLNVIENWNSATNFIHFGRLGEFGTNSIEDQELAMLALHLLQISLTFVQTLMIQDVLSEPAWEPDDQRGPARADPIALQQCQSLWPHSTQHGRASED
jgi:TnpA family transposase